MSVHSQIEFVTLGHTLHHMLCGSAFEGHGLLAATLGYHQGQLFGIGQGCPGHHGLVAALTFALRCGEFGRRSGAGAGISFDHTVGEGFAVGDAEYIAIRYIGLDIVLYKRGHFARIGLAGHYFAVFYHFHSKAQPFGGHRPRKCHIGAVRRDLDQIRPHGFKSQSGGIHLAVDCVAVLCATTEQ